MSATQQSWARTRAFARVIGPFLTITCVIAALHPPTQSEALKAFFDSPPLVWITGGLILLGGLSIIAFHQYWSNVTAALISLFGWLLALRGVVLLAAPQLIATGVAASLNVTPAVRIGFGLVAWIGLWLSYAGWIAKDPASS